ncbi:hypothetical protein BKA57DRAFT_474339 [Linnemannia elongata]|nr:hypothetical protein BKA57DRAFT_474339 [Linnemannia elongata]
MPRAPARRLAFLVQSSLLLPGLASWSHLDSSFGLRRRVAQVRSWSRACGEGPSRRLPSDQNDWWYCSRWLEPWMWRPGCGRVVLRGGGLVGDLGPSTGYRRRGFGYSRLAFFLGSGILRRCWSWILP